MMQEQKERLFPVNEKIHMMVCEHKHIGPHNHNFLELVYVRRGEAVQTLDGQRTLIRAGDYFIIDYGVYHQYDTRRNETFEIVNCLFTPELIDQTLAKCRHFRELMNHYLIRFSNYAFMPSFPSNMVFHDDGQVAQLVEKLLSEYEEQAPGYLELCRCHLVEIIILAARTLGAEEAIPQRGVAGYVKDYVERHYMEPITLTSLADNMKLSLPYLSRKFKEETGMTFQEYLQRKRIEQSCRLLANTDKKISEIAELVGYTCVKFYGQTFQKILAMTPREFRKNYG